MKRSVRSCWRTVWWAAAVAVGLGATPAALAQLGLPGGRGLPSLPSLPGLTDPLRPVTPLRDTASALAPERLETLRRDTIAQLLRSHPRELQADPAGEPVVRGELLAQPSAPAHREAWRAQGYSVLREDSLDGLDLAWAVLRPPPGVALPEALARLREADPAGHYDYHHLYTGSGSVATPRGRPGSSAALPAGGADGAASVALRVGLVDSGVDARHPALRGVTPHALGCADGQAHPAAHGTAVASLLVGREGRFRGAAPGAALWLADVYCDAPTGGSVAAVAQALAWLARERVAVINLSLVGPPNQLLQRAVAAVLARGHVVVAAAGNDGPAAPPLYPAAWPGVVAVSGTDARQRPLPEAARGPHVMFAAPGADLVAAAVGATGDAGYLVVRGTSFAAPLVAGLLAARLDRPDPRAAEQALQALAQEALDLGAPGRDDRYGWGLVGDALRVPPDAVRLARPAP